jgi:hypothetical protein
MRDSHEALNAVKTRLLEEAAEVDRDMEQLERLCAKYKLVVVASDPKPEPPPKPKSDFEQAQIEAEQMIRAAGRPMLIDELFPVIVKRGVVLSGKKPKAVLTSYIRRNENLRFLGHKDGWWLIDMPWPPGSAEPTKHANGHGPGETEANVSFAELKQRNKEALDRAMAAVLELLKGKTKPMKLRAIYDHLVSQGHKIPSKYPTMYLSTLLAKQGLKSHHRYGWTLPGVEWEIRRLTRNEHMKAKKAREAAQQEAKKVDGAEAPPITH